MEVLNTDHDSVPSDICYKSYIQNLEFVDVLMHTLLFSGSYFNSKKRG